MRFNVVIVDDELSGINVLTKMIEKYVPEATIVGAFSDSKEALIGIRKLNPDIVFSDIEMDDMSGMDMLSNLSHMNFTTVFVTAHNKYAIDAIRNNAFDYLLKPVRVKELLNVFRRLENRPIKPKVESSDSILLNTSSKVLFIPKKDIVMIEGGGSYCKFYLIDGAQEMVSKNLAHYERVINAPHFFRSHKSYLVNLKHVAHLNLEDGLTLELKGNLVALLSVSKKSEFLKAMRMI